MTPTPTVEKKLSEFAEDFHGNTGERQERLRQLVQQSPRDRVKAMSERVN